MSEQDEAARASADRGEHAVLEFRTFSLEVVEGPDKGQKTSFDRSVEIGTHPSCAFVLTDPTVSRRHCIVEITEEGYRVRDLRSRNGTRLARCKVGWAILRPGSTVQVGSTTFRFDVGATEHRVELLERRGFGRLLGGSTTMREAYALLEKVAASDATVLIEGESGTGKELAAEAIHRASRRKNKPFEVFDCASVPENLIESELFGHERGAFTGAGARKSGAFERADGGTIFLDEIGELPEALQPKLLRVLDSRQFRTVGGTTPLRVDVRVLAATNRDMREMVSSGKFRLDLFHRLAVLRIPLPPLRHRPDDIPLLIDAFLDECRSQDRPVPNISQETLARLQSYPWPGNVRELRNFIERGALLGEDFAEVPFMSTSVARLEDEVRGLDAALKTQAGAVVAPASAPVESFHEAKAKLVDTWEREYCARLVTDHKGNISAAARAAGLDRKSFRYLLVKHNLRTQD